MPNPSLTIRWLRAVTAASELSTEAKLSLITAASFSDDKYQVKITIDKVATICGFDADVVSSSFIKAGELGYVHLLENGTNRIFCQTKIPEEPIPKRSRVVKIPEKGNYEITPVRDWGASHFAQYFSDIMEKKGIPVPPSAILMRGILDDGVQKLRVFDRSELHPKIRYRMYLDWAVKYHSADKHHILRNRDLMMKFIKNVP